MLSMNRLTFGVVLALGVASGVAAQDVFHSPQAANLPTTATLPQGRDRPPLCALPVAVDDLRRSRAERSTRLRL